jgi:pimeloyl-ACP methyl ester carboxylesterase
MVSLDVEREAPRVPTIVFMGRRDESVPFDGVRAVWDRWEGSRRLVPGSRFVEIPDGDHGLVEHVDPIAAQVVALSGR